MEKSHNAAANNTISKLSTVSATIILLIQLFVFAIVITFDLMDKKRLKDEIMRIMQENVALSSELNSLKLQQSKDRASKRTVLKYLFDDPEYPFTFEYPGDWALEKQKVIWFGSTLDTVSVGPFNFAEGYKPPPKSTVMPSEIIRKQNIRIMGLPATKTLVAIRYESNDYIIFAEAIIDGKEYGFRLNSTPEKLKENEAIITQILSTFKPVDSTL